VLGFGRQLSKTDLRDVAMECIGKSLEIAVTVVFETLHIYTHGGILVGVCLWWYPRHSFQGNSPETHGFFFTESPLISPGCPQVHLPSKLE
jgi:hypothetical protein